MAKLCIFMLFAVTLVTLLSLSVTATDLIINSGTTTVGGNQIYGNVYVANGATLQVDSSTGWLNITANNITILGSVVGTALSNNTGGSSASQGIGSGGFPGGLGGNGGYYSSGAKGSGGGASSILTGTQTGRYEEKSTGAGAGGGGKGGNGYTGAPGSNGAGGSAGGATIRLSSPWIYIRGTLTTNGGNGGAGGKGGDGNTCGGEYGGSGGGGGAGGNGGEIIIDGSTVDISSSSFNSNGGGGAGGGAGGSCGGQTGNSGATGNGGRIKVFYTALTNTSTTTSVIGSLAGTVYYSQTGTTIVSNLTSPATGYINGNANTTFSCSANITFSDTAVTIANITLWGNFNGTWSANFTNSTIGSALNSTSIKRTIADGTYLWNCYACSSNAICAFAGANNSLTVNTISPSITLISPSGNSANLGQNISFNWSISSSVALNNCWFIYNGAQTNVPCSQNQSSFLLQGSNAQAVTFYANDTSNHLGSSYASWTYPIIIGSQSYNNQTIEGSTEVFTLNVSIPSGSNLQSGYFNYNGVSYLMSYTTSGNNYYFSKTMSIPFVASDSNISFSWTMNIDGTAYNTTTNNQSVRNMMLDDCSTYTNLIYNFSIRDEDTRVLMNTPAYNATMQLDLRISPYGTTTQFLNFTRTYNGSDNKKVCINIPLNASIFRTDIVASYSASLRVNRFYFVDNGTITNATNPNIELLDLLASESTTFAFQFTDTSGNPWPNAIVHVYRYYIGDGTYREVENGKLDAGGQYSIKLFEEDAIYYFTITKDSQLIYTSPTYTAKCLTAPACSLTLSQSQSFTPFPVNWNIINGTYIALSTNKNTRTASLYFVSNDIHTVNFTLIRIDSGNIQVLNTTSLTATAGSLNLYIPYAYGNQTFYVATYQDGKQIKYDTVNFNDGGRSIFGVDGLMLGFFFIVVLVLMAVSEGILLIVVGCIGIIILVAMALIDLGWLALICIICAGGLIAWRLIQRRK